WPISTVPFWQASRTWKPGTISPEAKGVILNLPSVISATRRQTSSAPPHRVSSDFGKLEVRRHLTSGVPCARAGAASAAVPVAAALTPAVLRNFRRCIWILPVAFLDFTKRLILLDGTKSCHAHHDPRNKKPRR